MQAVQHNESKVSDKKKIIVLGSGPNRIGQGIEFDYCCVHGLLAVKEAGFEAIMVNCNPETVSTDFDIADKLYFEPVFWEHLWAIIEHEKPYGITKAKQIIYLHFNSNCFDRTKKTLPSKIKFISVVKNKKNKQRKNFR